MVDSTPSEFVQLVQSLFLKKTSCRAVARSGTSRSAGVGLPERIALRLL
jgi:hypothetical protein